MRLPFTANKFSNLSEKLAHTHNTLSSFKENSMILDKTYTNWLKMIWEECCLCFPPPPFQQVKGIKYNFWCSNKKCLSLAKKHYPKIKGWSRHFTFYCFLHHPVNPELLAGTPTSFASGTVVSSHTVTSQIRAGAPVHSEKFFFWGSKMRAALIFIEAVTCHAMFQNTTILLSAFLFISGVHCCWNHWPQQAWAREVFLTRTLGSPDLHENLLRLFFESSSYFISAQLWHGSEKRALLIWKRLLFASLRYLR